MAGFKEGHGPKGLDQILAEFIALDPKSPDYRKNRILFLGELLTNHRADLEKMHTDLKQELAGLLMTATPKGPIELMENIDTTDPKMGRRIMELLNIIPELEKILDIEPAPDEEDENGDDKPTIH